MSAHAFNPSSQEVGAGESLSSRLVWSTKQAPGQLGLFHRKTLSKKKKEEKKRKGRFGSIETWPITVDMYYKCKLYSHARL